MKNLITSIIASTTPTVTLTINGKTFTGIPCTAYLPSIGETESDRRDMVVIDANENRAAEETAITLITEYVDEDDELIWDGLNTTAYSEDYGTAIAAGSYLFPHEPHTEDDREGRPDQLLPLSEVGGEDTIIEPAAERDDSEEYGDIRIGIDGVYVDAI